MIIFYLCLFSKWIKNSTNHKKYKKERLFKFLKTYLEHDLPLNYIHNSNLASIVLKKKIPVHYLFHFYATQFSKFLMASFQCDE